jgi:hypothetical protein
VPSGNQRRLCDGMLTAVDVIGGTLWQADND